MVQVQSLSTIFNLFLINIQFFILTKLDDMNFTCHLKKERGARYMSSLFVEVSHCLSHHKFIPVFTTHRDISQFLS